MASINMQLPSIYIYFFQPTKFACKGSFISFQLVPDTLDSDFPPPDNQKFDKIKKR